MLEWIALNSSAVVSAVSRKSTMTDSCDERASPSCCRMLVIFVVPSLLFGFSKTAFGQKNQPSSVRCGSGANPYRLPHEYTGRAFDFDEETLTRDWVGLRTYLDELGLKPTAS